MLRLEHCLLFNTGLRVEYDEHFAKSFLIQSQNCISYAWAWWVFAFESSLSSTLINKKELKVALGWKLGDLTNQKITKKYYNLSLYLVRVYLKNWSLALRYFMIVIYLIIERRFKYKIGVYGPACCVFLPRQDDLLRVTSLHPVLLAFSSHHFLW